MHLVDLQNLRSTKSNVIDRWIWREQPYYFQLHFLSCGTFFLQRWFFMLAVGQIRDCDVINLTTSTKLTAVPQMIIVMSLRMLFYLWLHVLLVTRHVQWQCLAMRDVWVHVRGCLCVCVCVCACMWRGVCGMGWGWGSACTLIAQDTVNFCRDTTRGQMSSVMWYIHILVCVRVCK